MSIAAPSPFVQPARPSGLTRRGLLKSGLGLAGVAGLVMPSTAAYAAAQAARDLIVTDYRPVPPRWPDAHRLSITVVADLHAGGPNMGLERVREVVDAAQALNSDLIVILGDFLRHPPLRDRAGAASGLGGRARPPQGAARRLCHPRQSRLVVRPRRRAQRLGGGAHPGAGKRRRAAGRSRPPLLAGRAGRPARVLARAQPLPRRRRFAGHARAHRHRRPGDSAGARAGHFHQSAGARRPDARRPHPWRTDRAAVHRRRSGRRRNMARASPMATSSSRAAT